MRTLLSCSLLAALTAACSPASTPASPRMAPPGPGASVTATSTGIDIRLRNDDQGISSSVDASPERVWAALPEVYRELGIPEGTIDPVERVYGNRRVTLPRIGGERTSQLVRCGSASMAGPMSGSQYRTRLSVLTWVQEEGGKTSVTTQVGASARRLEGTSTEEVACASTGRLEARIAELLAARLGGGAASRAH